MGFRDLAKSAESKATDAKRMLQSNLAIWEQNFVGLADHLVTNGLAFADETEALLDRLREALAAEKAKLDAELAPPPVVDEIAAAKAE